MSTISASNPPGTAKGIAVEDTSFSGFYSNMTAPEKRTFWACAAGWGLDGMDFMIFPLVIGTITKMWNVDNGDAGLAVTATLLASAFGGWFAGFISDRIGRVRTLQITILWFSLFSLLCAFAQNFSQLLIARALLGFGFGGEWAVGAVLIGETVRAHYRGRAVGAVQSAWALGWGAAVLMQALLFSHFPASDAWRYMFIVGALPALLVFYIRRLVKEPAVSAETRAREEASNNLAAIWEIFCPGILGTTVLAALMSTGAQGGYYAIMTWLPKFLTNERGLSITGSALPLSVLIFGSFAGYLTGAWLSDRIGRRSLFLIYSFGAVTAAVIYTEARLSNHILWFLGFPLGFFASGYFSGMGPFLTELFPTRLRGSGQGFCYNFGRGIGALFPMLTGYMSASMSLASAIALLAFLAYGLFFVCAAGLPETRGKILHPDT